jgi:hypothetical protein
MAKEERSKSSKKIKIFTLFIFSLFLFSLLPVGNGAEVIDTGADTEGPMILDGDYPILISPEGGGGARDGDGEGDAWPVSAGTQLPPGPSSHGLLLYTWPVAMEENDVWWCLYKGDDLIMFQQAKIDTQSYIVINAWFVSPPDMQVPAFAEPGSYEFVLIYNSGEYDDWWKNILFWWSTWVSDIQFLRWDLDVQESSLQDNLFAPYVIFIDDIGGRPYNIIIPCLLFDILAVIFFIIFIKFVVPLWLRIPKAARVDLNIYRNRKVKKI